MVLDLAISGDVEEPVPAGVEVIDLETIRQAVPASAEAETPETVEGEPDEDVVEGEDPEIGNDDKPLPGGEYPGDGAEGEGPEIQDPDEQSATKAALTSEFD